MISFNKHPGESDGSSGDIATFGSEQNSLCFLSEKWCSMSYSTFFTDVQIFFL